MDLEYIIEELKPLDYHKESKCLTLIFPNSVIIFLREWENNELMWHIFQNRQSIEAGVDEERYIVPLLKNYINEIHSPKPIKTLSEG